MWRINMLTHACRHKTFRLSAPCWSWHRVILSYHSWKLTFHTVHFMASWLMPWNELKWSVRRREHDANLSQHEVIGKSASSTLKNHSRKQKTEMYISKAATYSRIMQPKNEITEKPLSNLSALHMWWQHSEIRHPLLFIIKSLCVCFQYIDFEDKMCYFCYLSQLL